MSAKDELYDMLAKYIDVDYHFNLLKQDDIFIWDDGWELEKSALSDLKSFDLI